MKNNTMRNKKLKEKIDKEELIKKLKEKLDEHISNIEKAYSNADIEEIKKQWNKFFKTDYFTSISEQKNRCEDNEMFIDNFYSTKNLAPIKLEIKCQRFVSKYNSDKATHYNCLNNEKFSLIKNKDEQLCFSIDTVVTKPYILLWKVKNNGDMAIANNSLRGEIHYGNNEHSFTDDPNSFKRYESISFEGNHYVEAYLIKSDKCIAKSRFNVTIE